MKLNEERSYEKLMEILDGLDLTEENRQLAAKYFHPAEAENPALLEKAVLQDFSGLAEENQRKSASYVEQCAKRKRTEEMGRYIRFTAAVGGSTAYYLLSRHLYRFWSMEGTADVLTKEQKAAMMAEGMVWNQYQLSYRCTKQLSDMEKKTPGVLYRAMGLCCQKYDNARVLLGALYLNTRKPAEKKGGMLKGIFGRSQEAEDSELGKAREFLEKNFIDSLENLFDTQGISPEELEALQKFAKEAAPDTPISPEISRIAASRGKGISSYLTLFLSGCAFLAYGHSERFSVFLRLLAALNPENVLSACRDMSGDSWFAALREELERILPAAPERYIRWYLDRRDEEGLKRFAGRCPRETRTVAEQASTEDYQFLMRQVQKGNPALFKEMDASYSGAYQTKMADELVEGMTNGRAEARQYLLGEEELPALYPYVNNWRGEYNYNYQRFQKLKSLQKNGGRMFRRGLILESLRMQGTYFIQNVLSYRGKKDDEAYRKNREEQMEYLVRIFEKEGLPVRYQADAIEGIYSCYYSDNDKKVLLDASVEVLSRRGKEHAEEFREALKTSTAIGRGICLRVLNCSWQEEKEVIFSSAMDSSKQVKEVLASVCAAHREGEPEIRALLDSRKLQERELAVSVMRQWGIGDFREELKKALDREKSKKLKGILEDCLGVKSGSEGEQKQKTPEELVAEVLKGGKKRKAAWAYETPFSAVHKKDGTEASEEYMQALLVSYADLSVPGLSSGGARLSKELEETELHQYMSELLDKWLEAGAEAKKKWVLYAVSVHGGEEIVPVFWKQIQEWPQHARGAMAAEAVKALALNGSSQALLLVDQISRKFKFRQVKLAAGEALEFAASSLGISRAELEDRIVPNLGFDESFKRIFDYGTRSFSVYLTPALELEVYDGEEKKLKNLPAPGKRDQEEQATAAYGEYKQLKKQLKTVISNQKLRLEQALIGERIWKAEAWKELFVNNPVMHQFAIGLIWGIYEEGALKETFRYMEDGSFNTLEEEELELPEEGSIGLVHPIELSEEELEDWKEQLSDYEITQPIEQLERRVYRISEEEKEAEELTRFGGMLLNGLSLSGKLQGMGWYRGSVQDGGVYDTFYREDAAMAVELEFSGSFVGDENDDVTVYGAAFYKSGTVKRGSYVYDKIKPENRFRLGEVSPRYFSEIVLELSKATASSQEKLDYPQCKER